MRVKRGQTPDSPKNTQPGVPRHRRRRGGVDKKELRNLDYNAGSMMLSPEALGVTPQAGLAGRGTSLMSTNHNRVNNPRLLGRITQSAEEIAKSKSFRITKYGGRVFLVVALGMDAYEIYTAEDRAAETAEKVGAWGTAAVASSAAGNVAAPLLAGGPMGWVAYGVIVGGAGLVGYIAGSKAGEVIYEAGSKADFDGADHDEGLAP